MNIDEKIAEYKADIEKCERVCAVTAIGSIRDAAMRKAEEHRQLAAWLKELKAYRAENEGKKMNGSFELTLNNPLTKEDWDKIMDVELENTPSVTFKTPKGKEVKYIKADILDKIRKEIQRLRGCSCSCSDGIIDDVEDILDKYKAESEE